jgi:hypothetical protein
VGRVNHGALLLFLCGIDDLEKHEATERADDRSRLFMRATKKLRCAEDQFQRPNQSPEPTRSARGSS